MGSAHHEAFGDLFPLEGWALQQAFVHIEPYKDRTTLSTIPIYNGSGPGVWPVTCCAHNMDSSECFVNCSQDNGLCSPWSLWWLVPDWGLDTSTGRYPHVTLQRQNTQYNTNICSGSGSGVWPVTCRAHNMDSSECLVHLSQNKKLYSPWSLGDLLPLEDLTLQQAVVAT